VKRRSGIATTNPWFVVSFVFSALWLLPHLWAPIATSDMMLASLRPVFLATGQPFFSSAAHALSYFVGLGAASTPVAASPLLLWYLGASAASLAHYVLLVIDFSLLFFLAARIFSDSRLAALTVAIALAASESRLDRGVPFGSGLLGPTIVAAILAIVYGWYLAEEKPLLGYLYSALGTLYAIAFSPGAALLAGIASAAALAVTVIRRSKKRPAPLCIALSGSLVLATTIVAMRSLHFPAVTWDTLHSYFELTIAGLPASYRAAGHLHLGGTPALYHWTGKSFRYVDDRFIFVPSAPPFASVLAVLGACIVAIAGRAVYLASDARFRQNFLAFALGAALFIFPPLAVVASLSRAPVVSSGIWVLEHFGFAIIAVAILRLAAWRYPRYAAVVTYLVAIGALVTMIGNARASVYSYSTDAPNEAMRSAIIAAARSGFFARLPRGATIYL